MTQKPVQIKSKKSPIKPVSKKPVLKNKILKPFPVVAIGASAGGLEAISALLKKLPADTGMAFIYVQHLSPNHKSFLTTILSKITKMKVQEIDNMELMKPNNVYVIPPNKEIQVTNGHIRLLPRAKDSHIITIDILFSSLAITHKANVIGVILSGYANDGMVGLMAIKRAGGITFAQDDSAQASSMPRAAIDSGGVDFIMSPDAIADKLAQYSSNGFHLSKPKIETRLDVVDTNNEEINSIFELLLKTTGVDFSHYKLPTIRRRLNHKMQQSGIKTTKLYLKFLMKDSKEVDLLYKDLLINVTGFFRDKAAFAYLKSTFLPKLLSSKTPSEVLRIWVPGCSSGEEAYSIAILIAELMKGKPRKIPVQIFATDLSDTAIYQARIGKYEEAEVKTIPKKYLEQYFIKKGESYQVIKELRDMCVFAPHNILRDPPFSRMDFVSCCNLLIYFDTAAQKRVFETIYFALNDSGYVMLGKAETIGNTSALFNRINTKYKIYARKKGSGTRKINELTPRFPRTNLLSRKVVPALKTTPSSLNGIEQALDTALLADYMPACAVINKEMDIIQFRGPVSVFLAHPSGKASLNILKMTRPEFAFELRNAINKTIKTKQPTSKSGIEIKVDNSYRLLSFNVSHLKLEGDEPLFLIVFNLHEFVEKISDKADNGKNKINTKNKRITQLLDELNNTRSEMNSILETQDSTFEELQSANEEIVSSNEEFQTLNEELETSKEEIEATNEELISTNVELQMRNDLLNESHEYSEAIIATLHEPMVILDSNFLVKSANRSFYKKFHVRKEETEGQSLFELGNRQWNILKLREMLNEIIIKKRSFENFEVKHDFPGIGDRVMLLNANLIVQKTNSEKLILLAIEDISERYRYYQKERFSLSLIEASLDPLVTVNREGKITDLNNATVKITGLSRHKLIGTDFFEYFVEKQKAREVYQQIFDKNSVINYPLTLKNKNGKLIEVLFNGSVYKDDKMNTIGAVIVARDVTAQNRFEKELMEAKLFAELATELAEDAKVKAEKATLIALEAVKAKQQFLSNMSHEIRTPMNAIIGFTKVALKTELTVKQKEYLSAIKMSGDAMITLINDILDLAKVDSGKMVFEKVPFHLHHAIKAMLHLFKTKVQEKGLTLSLEYDDTIPKTLIGDSARLHQVILNLLSNAIKFTSKGKIIVKVALKEQSDKRANIRFEVSDTGIGIQKDKLEKIFENFQQASSGTSRIYGGTGLGLTIAKQLVESQGGKIEVKSIVNKGSSFSFNLDFERTDDEVIAEVEVMKLDNELKNIRILVVEDVVLNQLLMKAILRDFGFEYDIADNGEIAIRNLKTSVYDLILMDIQMPVMDGFETTEYIRKKLKLKLPIIALTADVTAIDVDKCKAIGMNDYISKPVDEKLLYTKIIKYLKKKK